MKQLRKARPTELFENSKISRKQAKKLIENICPSLIKTSQLRNIVRRAVRKTQSKEFVDKLDIILVLSGKLQDLVEQDAAEYPNAEILKRQKAGMIEREIHDTVLTLAIVWKKLLALA